MALGFTNLWGRAIATLVVIALMGCTANNHRRDQPTLQAKIIRSDPKGLWHRDATGREVVVACSEITNIRHPGGTSFFLGAALGLAGVLANSFEPERLCTECGPNIRGGEILIALAVPMTLISGVVWLRSHGAAAKCHYGAR